ncbi:hypothetical protein HDU91_006645, partial [Kappamyces sp. JEL0680]
MTFSVAVASLFLHLVLGATTEVFQCPSSADYSNGAISMDNGRGMRIVNNCKVPVSVSMISGSCPYAAGKSQCFSDGDCVQGGSCNLDNHICFWKNPTGATTFSPGQSKTITFPYYNNGLELIYSGLIHGCVPGKTCDASGLPVGQSTKAEFSLQHKAVDYYDITLIDGFSLPMSMTAMVGNDVLRANDPYYCTSPGSQCPRSSQTGPCSWQGTPPSTYQNWVTYSASAPGCQRNSDCPSGQTCGIANPPPGFPQSYNLVCGSLLG